MNLQTYIVGSNDGDIKQLTDRKAEVGDVLSEALVSCSQWMDVTQVRGTTNTPIIPSYPRLWVMEIQPTCNQRLPVKAKEMQSFHLLEQGPYQQAVTIHLANAMSDALQYASPLLYFHTVLQRTTLVHTDCCFQGTHK